MNISLNSFRSWLEHKDEDEVVGKASNPCRCPAAQYLKEVEPEFVSIGYSQIGLYDSVEVAPQWMQRFIINLDARYRDSSVTARQARIALEE